MALLSAWVKRLKMTKLAVSTIVEILAVKLKDPEFRRLKASQLVRMKTSSICQTRLITRLAQIHLLKSLLHSMASL